MQTKNIRPNPVLLNPYHDTEERQAHIDALRASGVTFRLEQLWTKDGEYLCIRFGLMDSAGFFAEYWYTPEGEIDARSFMQSAINIDGDAPAFWAIEAL